MRKGMTRGNTFFFKKTIIGCAIASMMFSTYPTYTLAKTDDVTVENVKSSSNKLNVQTRTVAQIRNYFNSNNIQNALKASVTYTQKPVLSGNYFPGKVAAKTLTDSVSILNMIRYIAGIPSDVKLKGEYNTYCQAGVMLNAVNGQLSHFPNQPDGMSDELYETGYKGASSSNIAWGYGNLVNSLVSGWLDDSDPYNIEILGHRRWMLNPKMGYTGFGVVDGFTSMYSFDYSQENASEYSNVAWPAKYTPISLGDYRLFSDSCAWSLSTGCYEDESKIKVTLTRTNDGKKWTFSSSHIDGDFYVDNNGYGQPGCIIFRPDENISYKAGDKFNVKIEGLSKGTLEYPVTFFNMVTSIKNTNISIASTNVEFDGNEKKPQVTIKSSDTKLTLGKDYSIYYDDNVKVGKAKITIKGKGLYTGSVVKYFNIVPARTQITDCSNVANGISIKWKKARGAASYEVLRKQKGASSFEVIGTTKNLSYIDKNAQSGKVYYYNIRCCNNSMKSSMCVSKVIDCLSVCKVNELKKGNNGVVVGWSKVNGAAGYYVYRKIGNGSFVKIATVDNKTLKYKDTKGKFNKTYSYAVRAYKASTMSAYTAKTVG